MIRRDVNLEVDEDLVLIAQEIVGLDLTPDEWSARASDDEFQRGRYVGGYDAVERAFCFGASRPNRSELWFQFDLAEAAAIASGAVTGVRARRADL
jgi:hypothetical protein